MPSSHPAPYHRRHKPASALLPNIQPCRTEQNPADRRARQMGMCQELAELGMGVARAAAAHALHEFAAPPQIPMPGSAAPRPESAALLFSRISRTVRQAIALECRIAAQPTGGFRTLRPLDPRRAPLQRALQRAIAHQPDADELLCDAMERLDTELDIETGRRGTVHEILAAICRDLGIDPPDLDQHEPDPFEMASATHHISPSSSATRQRRVPPRLPARQAGPPRKAHGPPSG